MSWSNLQVKGIMTSAVSPWRLIQPPMLSNNHYSVYARDSVISLQKYLDDNPIAYRTCSELWKVRAGDSRSSIEKAFKQVTGYGIKEYLVKLRLEYSKQYLRDGMPIKRVAAKSFYRSQSAYCTAFKRYFNQSPTDWLKNGQQ
jgi:AraC-like DNA-binding protein